MSAVAPGTAVTCGYRVGLAAGASLLLHLALLGALARQPAPPPPAPPRALDVVLATPAQAVANAPPAIARTEPAAKPATSLPTTPPADAPRPAPAETAAPSAADPPAEEPPPSPPPPFSGRALLAEATQRLRAEGLSATPGAAAPATAAQQAAVARYIDDWTRRVEAYGNRVYPAPRHLHGQLRIRAVIGRDGELRRAEVIQSSGHPELDRAALATLREAAPYRPFDRGLGARESLTITRVWRFGQGNHFGVRHDR